MRIGMIPAVAAILGLAALGWAANARADTTVIGGGFEESCSSWAKAVAAGQAPGLEAIHVCDLAIETEVLPPHQLAATHVNRGVLHMAAAEWAKAVADFNEAAAIEPGLGEAYVNRGAALIGEGRLAEGVAEIDRGLALNPEAPEKAYFNRGVGKERLHDLKGAYLDFMKAAELKPGWALPQAELARFTVVKP